ncbi:MAG TPA: hypothetical protein VED87_01855, partial [Methylocystis sp.]|nr:hypothetical protein [Methylocystis sp.]
MESHHDPGRGALEAPVGAISIVRPPARPQEIDARRRRGRGAVSNISGRYEVFTREAADDGWGSLEALAPFKTHIHVEKPRSVITK